MEHFRRNITFRDDADHGMRPGFRLSNWPDGTWEISDGLLWQRRDRIAERDERRQYARTHYGGDTSWIRIREAPWPALVTGGTDWADYTAKTTVRVIAGGRAGLAVRWEDGRHCYYFLLEDGRDVAVYRRQQDDLVELARQPFPHTADAFYTLTVSVRGKSLTCTVDDGPTLEVTDSHFPTGGVALVAECPAAYRSLEISGVRRPASARRLPSHSAPRKQLTIPAPAHDPSAAMRPVLRQLHGEPLIILRPDEGRELRLIGPDGGELCSLGPWDEAPGSVGDFPVQVFDLNGDGRDEAVLIVDGKIRVYDLTGEQLAEAAVPAPNPYGECANDPQRALVNDALCPVRLNGRGDMGFYIKDRYWNIHLYDSRLRHLWHKALNTGHFPLPVDVDGDGRDEILCGHTLLDVDGQVIWSAELTDHTDGAALVSLTDDGPRRFYLTAGEAGLVCLDPATGQILTQLLLGHVQHGWIGRFIDGQSQQILITTLWREPNIHYLLDDQLREVARWELDLGKDASPPSVLPWGDRDLLAGDNGIVDPLTGERLIDTGPWPAEQHPLGQWVVDWPGAGPSRLVQLLTDRIDIWRPEDDQVRRASPVGTFFSGYLPR